MLSTLIFYPTAIILLIFAILAIFAEKIVKSLVIAIGVFFLCAVLFYLLQAEYLAIMQLSIYGLAIPILLAIALMFTNTRAEKNTITSGARKYLILLALSMFAIGVIYLVCISLNITESQTFADITQAENYIRIFDAITEGFLKRFIIKVKSYLV